ncbi:hypothetical protein Tco_0790161 [Tanacetum coccineum]
MSTAEAEYVSLSLCCLQVIWMRTQLLDYGYKYNRISMYCDSKSAIAISCNPVQHSHTKHINIQYHFIKEHVEKGTVKLYFVGTEYQLVDLFTKALPKERFEYLVLRIDIIMAQRQADVHQDELCPPNKWYALMDANKKIDLHNPFIMDLLGAIRHTLKEDGSKYRLSFMLDRKELTMTLDDFRTIFQLPQATNNNHDRFVVAPKFSEMVPFYLNDLGFTLELRSPSNFKTTGLIMQMLYCFVNNVHVDYAELLLEGLHYSLEHPSTLIPYPRFTKLIVSHYMTAYPEISRRVRDKYHNLEHDEMVKSIFNSRKNKAGIGMKIPNVPTTQSQPIESTHGTHRITSAPRTPNLDVNEGESSAQQKYTIIRLRIPPRRSTRLTPPTPVLTTAEVEDIIVQDTIQLSIAEQKSRDDLEAQQNVEKVKEHLAAEEIEKMVEGTENVDYILDSQNDSNTRLEPRSYKESPEVEKTAEIQPVNTIKEEEESVEDDYELRRRETGRM